MPLLTLKEVLQKSIEERYAVGAFNISNHDLAEGVIKAAEETGLPVIVNVAEVHYGVLDIENFIHYLLDRINRSRAPITLHLDHGYTYENIIRAIHYGFSSVMFDGSKLPLAENIARTREIVKVAHAAGVSVEAELGHVGGLDGDPGKGNVVDEKAFTKPDEAVEFVRETGIDALAVAVGTVHGIYSGEPKLNIELLKVLRERINIPLVLHGGTGLSREEFQRAVAYGINKINFYTGLYLPAVRVIEKEIEDHEGHIEFGTLTSAAREKIKEIVIEQMEIFGTKPL